MEDLNQEVELVEEGQEFVEDQVDDFEDEKDSSAFLIGAAIGVGATALAGVIYKKAVKPGFRWLKNKIVESAKDQDDSSKAIETDSQPDNESE